MPATSTEVAYNRYAFAVHDDPYETYRRLRDEAPADWNDELGFCVLSRFETCSRHPLAELVGGHNYFQADMRPRPVAVSIR